MARSKTDTTANAANGSVTVRERVARMDKIGNHHAQVLQRLLEAVPSRPRDPQEPVHLKLFRDAALR